MRGSINLAGLARHVRFLQLVREWLRARKAEEPKVEPVSNDSQEAKPEITIGSLWTFRTDDPFPSKYPPVEVIGVKNGWVRYHMGTLLPDERRDIDSFLYMYEPAKEA